jgi:pilus assembly protein CpaC
VALKKPVQNFESQGDNMKKYYTRITYCLLLAAATLCLHEEAQAQTQAVVTKNPVSSPTTATTPLTVVGPALELIIGKSKLLQIPSPIERISVGAPSIADVTLISPLELYVLGKSYGSTNVVIWRKGGGTTAIDVNVSIDADRMERKLLELLPDEKNIRVRPAADSVILTGVVSSALKAKYAEDIANAFVRDINKNLVLPLFGSDNKVTSGTSTTSSAVTTTGSSSGGTGASAKVVNLLQVSEGQQVMLEVIVAEISKTLLDKLGSNLSIGSGSGMRYDILSQLLVKGVGQISLTADNGNSLILDAKKEDGLIKVLAEPNIVAISGQEASFLAGGKIFIPVARTNLSTGGSTITLEEKEFGVGLKFTPTVLEGGRIHLKVSPEVSELTQTGSPFTTVDGSTSILPSVTTRRVQTTVQLMDGQSLAIAGLIKNNVTQTSKRSPLGDIPILGVLFRSSEFQNDRTELIFLITPRLVKPLNGPTSLPTDQWLPPTRTEFLLGGKLEGSRNAPSKLEPRP